MEKGRTYSLEDVLFWPRQATSINVTVQQCKTDGRKLFRLKITNPDDRDRYHHTESPNVVCHDYNGDPFEFGEDNFELVVNQLGFRYKFLDTLVISDQFLETSIQLEGENSIIGIGERRGPLTIGQDHFRHGIWNRDTFPQPNSNLYGDQPIWVARSLSGRSSFGCLWWNSNAKSFEISRLQEDTIVTMRSNGGLIDIFFAIDKDPHEVTKTIHSVLGPLAVMPDWSLGYQLCRWGYDSAKRTFEGQTSNTLLLNLFFSCRRAAPS